MNTRSVARRLRLRPAIVAAAVVLATPGACLATVAPATPGDAEIDALLREIEQLPRATYAARPTAWREVFDQIEHYLRTRQAARVAETPGPVPTMSGAQTADWVASFRQLIGAARALPVTDLASRMVSIGMNGDASRDGGAAATPLVEMARWVAPMPGDRPIANAAEVGQLLLLVSSDSTRLLLRRAELSNAGRGDAERLNQAMRDSLAGLKQRSTHGCEQLLKLRYWGREIAQRLSAMEALVLTSLTTVDDDAAADSARVAQWRAQLAALQGQQTEALAGATDVVGGPRPSRQARSAARPVVSRSALAADVQRRIEAVQAQGTDPASQAMTIARLELWLGALDALAREELIQAAVLRRGEQAEDELMQIGAEMRRLSGAVDRATAR